MNEIHKSQTLMHFIGKLQPEESKIEITYTVSVVICRWYVLTAHFIIAALSSEKQWGL